MLMRRFCTTCQMDKPAAGFKLVLRGRVKVPRCEDCRTRKKARTIEERDAFGREITARNKASTAAMVRHARNMLEGKQQ